MAVNQYKRDGNSPNDYRKGNRTDSRRETSHFTGAMKVMSDDIAYYKDIAEKVRRQRKYKQEDVIKVYRRINDYIEECNKADKPLTVSGMIKASGISKATWYEMLSGDYDYQLYQIIDYYNIDIDSAVEYDSVPVVTITIDNKKCDIMLIQWSEVLQKAMLSIEQQTEERLYMKGRVGDIFSLKAIHGWQEEAQPHTVNQTLVIASEDQARKAIELLK